MHLLNSAREGLICVPVVHEVAAAIATEYHNATVNSGAAATGTGKAFALVTAGPGLTNTLTGIAGAWLESRELLLIGGQVKVDLITQLAPRTARARRKLVHKYQFSHGAQRHPIPERPLAA
jgi:thiamine pyrophosphate-dependent acetolactate synthase large subunit-like protein